MRFRFREFFSFFVSCYAQFQFCLLQSCYFESGTSSIFVLLSRSATYSVKMAERWRVQWRTMWVTDPADRSATFKAIVEEWVHTDPDGGITLDEFSRSSSRCHRCRPMLQFPGANLDHFTNMTEDLSSIAPVTEASCTNACHPQLCGTFRGPGTCGRRKSHRMRLRLLLGRLRKALTTSKCKTHGGRHGHATNFRPTHGSQKLSVKSQLFHLRTGGSRASVFLWFFSATSHSVYQSLTRTSQPKDIFEDFSIDGSNLNDEIAKAGLSEQAVPRQSRMAYNGSATSVFSLASQSLKLDRVYRVFLTTMPSRTNSMLFSSAAAPPCSTGTPLNLSFKLSRFTCFAQSFLQWVGVRSSQVTLSVH